MDQTHISTLDAAYYVSCSPPANVVSRNHEKTPETSHLKRIQIGTVQKIASGKWSKDAESPRVREVWAADRDTWATQTRWFVPPRVLACVGSVF